MLGGNQSVIERVVRVVVVDAVANKRCFAVAATELHGKVLLFVEGHLGNNRTLALQDSRSPLVECAVVVWGAGWAEDAFTATRPRSLEETPRMLGCKLFHLADCEQLHWRWASGITDDFRQSRMDCYGCAPMRKLAIFGNLCLVGQLVVAHAARKEVVAQRHVPSPRLIAQHMVLQVISVD